MRQFNSRSDLAKFGGSQLEGGGVNRNGTRPVRKRESESNVKSAHRALALLELLENLRRPIRVSEAAKLLRCPQSSASVLLNSLTKFGYLTFNRQTREFAPSVRIALIGSNIDCDGVPATRLRCLLGAIRKLTGLTTALVVRNGIYVQHIYTANVTGWQLTEFSPGSTKPLTHHASGIVILADCTDAEVAPIVRHLNVVNAGGSVDRLEDVLNQVRECRESGYAFLQRERAALAVNLPIRDSFGNALVLSVSGSTADIEGRREDLFRIIRDTIDQWLQDIREH